MEGVSPEQASLIRHWSAYGQRGKTPDHRVGPHEWHCEPFSKPVSTECLYPRLKGDTITTHIFMSGTTDPKMIASEDKWFVYADGPDDKEQVRLHAYRSWSGLKMMELHIDAGFDGYGRAGGRASITTIKRESDPEKAWKDGDAKTYIKVARQVCSWVLNVQLGPSTNAEDLDPSVKEAVVLPTADSLIAATENVPTEKATVYRRA